MDIEDLVYQITCKEPNFEVIRRVLDGSPELVRGIIWENASILHLAARNDVLNGTQLVQWLVENFKADVNYSNDGGSVPLLWALAAIQEAIETGKEYNVLSVEWMVRCAGIKMNKMLLNRGELKEFIKEFFESDEIWRIVEGV